MKETQKKRNTPFGVTSSPPGQLPLRGPGLNVHDAHAHDHPDQKQHEQQHNSDQRSAIIKQTKKHGYLKIEPPFQDRWVGHQCAVWANQHPVTRDYIECEQLSTIAFEAAKNRYIDKRYSIYKCNPDQKTLAEKLGVSVKTVQRINRRFEEFGVFKIKRLRDDKTKKSMNFYILPD